MYRYMSILPYTRFGSENTPPRCANGTPRGGHSVHLLGATWLPQSKLRVWHRWPKNQKSHYNLTITPLFYVCIRLYGQRVRFWKIAVTIEKQRKYWKIKKADCLRKSPNLVAHPTLEKLKVLISRDLLLLSFWNPTIIPLFLQEQRPLFKEQIWIFNCMLILSR